MYSRLFCLYKKMMIVVMMIFLQKPPTGLVYKRPCALRQQYYFSNTYALCVIFMILVSLENVKKCALGGCMITSKTKINIFEKISLLLSLFLWRHSTQKFFKKHLFQRGKQCIVLPNYSFFCVLAHCALKTSFFLLILY